MKVEVDPKGRILISAQVRKKIRNTRFELRVENSSIILQGVPEPESVRGKYKGLLKGRTISQIEEDQEEFVSRNRRIYSVEP